MPYPLYGPTSRFLPDAQSPDDALKTLLGIKTPTTPDQSVQEDVVDPRVGKTIAVPDSASEPPQFSTDPDRDAEAYRQHNEDDYQQKQALVDFFNPQNQQKNQQDFSQKLALAEGPARVAAQGQMAIEQAKGQSAIGLQHEKAQGTKSLLDMLGAGGNASGAQGSIQTPWKPAVNANGSVSLTQATPPVQIQRAHDQLADARAKMQDALDELERQKPGITKEVDTVDSASSSPSWLSTLMGTGPKYGGAADAAQAANERLKYSTGVPTPYAKLAQDVSFGNIEQMAGQLPGVRGLATIVPLFKEHQANWGHETPLATAQRMKHLLGIMDQTLSGIETGSFNEPGNSTTIGGDDDRTNPEYQPH